MISLEDLRRPLTVPARPLPPISWLHLYPEGQNDDFGQGITVSNWPRQVAAELETLFQGPSQLDQMLRYRDGAAPNSVS